MDAIFRCVRCRKSTKNKQFKKCNQSALDGGRICIDCFAEIPNKNILNCHLWASSTSNSTCSWCSKSADISYECCICGKPSCSSCLTRTSLDLLINKGFQFPICVRCLPSDSLGQASPTSNSWCLVCLDHHTVGLGGSLICPYDGSVTPPLVRTLKGTQLPKVTPSPSLMSITPSVLPNNEARPPHGGLSLANLESISSRSGEFCPSGPCGSEDFFNFRSCSKSQKLPHISVATDTNDNGNNFPSDKIKTRSSSSGAATLKNVVLNVPSPDSDSNDKFKAIEGTASNIQLINFMASISTQMKSMSEEVNSLKKTFNNSESIDTSISGDTSTCKGIQWSLKDQQFAKKSIPLSQSETIAQQQAMISEILKSLSSVVVSLDKNSKSKTPPTSESNKFPKKNGKKNTKLDKKK